MSGTNSYTGPTSVSGGYLALVGPGSIAMSRGVNVSAGGMFDISATNSGASIRHRRVHGRLPMSACIFEKTITAGDIRHFRL